MKMNELEKFEKLWYGGVPPLAIMREMGISQERYEKLKEILENFKRYHPHTPKTHTLEDLRQMWTKLEGLIDKIANATSIEDKIRYEKQFDDLAEEYSQIDINSERSNLVKKQHGNTRN